MIGWKKVAQDRRRRIKALEYQACEVGPIVRDVLSQVLHARCLMGLGDPRTQSFVDEVSTEVVRRLHE